jgi:mitochondrial chaperone BCS1
VLEDQTHNEHSEIRQSTNMEELSKYLPVDNQFFTGGIGIAALGVAATFARKFSAASTLMFRRHFMTTLEVTSKDLSYPWVLQWLNTQGRRTQHLSASTIVKKLADGRESALAFDLVPGPGRHLIWHRGRPYSVERIREQQMLDLNSGNPWEKILFTTFGRDTEVFNEVLAEARDMAIERDEGKLVVYTNWGTEWRPFGHPRTKRPLDSVILAEGMKEDIVNDLNDWRGSSQWYTERGIPYRRGYLLHGPPGCGKSSFVSALAGHLDYNICILSLNESGLTDDRLAQALSNVPQQSIVLLEDIDAAFHHRNPGEYNRSHVTFSGLLNCLDGVSSAEERVLFMTTNHIDRLEPALLRPGRVDAVHLIDHATVYQIEELYCNFYPDEMLSLDDETTTTSTKTREDAKTFAQALGKMDINFSIADIQGYLMQYKQSPKQALENTNQLREMVQSRVVKRSSSEKHNSAQSNFEDTNFRAGRRISASDVDKVAFNPQEGWEEEVNLRK